LPFTTSGQEMERVYYYNTGARMKKTIGKKVQHQSKAVVHGLKLVGAKTRHIDIQLTLIKELSISDLGTACQKLKIVQDSFSRFDTIPACDIEPASHIAIAYTMLTTSHG